VLYTLSRNKFVRVKNKQPAPCHPADILTYGMYNLTGTNRSTLTLDHVLATHHKTAVVLTNISHAQNSPKVSQNRTSNSMISHTYKSRTQMISNNHKTLQVFNSAVSKMCCKYAIAKRSVWVLHTQQISALLHAVITLTQRQTMTHSDISKSRPFAGHYLM
jgi:hypothetical protein